MQHGIVPLIALSAALYAVAWALHLRRMVRAAHVAMAAGWGANLLLFVVNGVLAGEPPFGNMYHVQVFLALCFPPLYLALAKRERLDWTAAYFAFAAALPLVGALFMDRDVHWRRMPALQSAWFVPHVFAYMVSYALATVAFVLTVVKWRRRGVVDQGRDHAEAAHQIIRMAFPFMTFGMLSGALWADDAWGVYWSWDSKETWSLVTWLGYVAFLHAWKDAGLTRWRDGVQAFAFAALVCTFFLVNLLPRLASALHSYAR